MRIGVDIDGTLTDIAKFQIEEGKKFFGREPVNTKVLDVKDMFECSDEEEKAFWKKNYMKYCVLGKMRNGSDKFTKNAHNNDDEIIIITSRKYTDQDTKLGKLMRYTVEQWLKHNGIETDKIIYCNEDKTAAIKDNKIDIGILCVPKNGAQELADRLVACGVKGLWNFAPMDLKVPDDIIVENVNLTESLFTLSYLMK